MTNDTGGRSTENDASEHPAPCLAPHRSCVCDLFRPPPSACAFPGCTEQHPWRPIPPASTDGEVAQ